MEVNSFKVFNSKMLEINNAYKASVIDVNMSMLNIQMSTLPELNYLPPNWKEIEGSFLKLKKESLNWASSVLYKLDSVPNSILDRDGAIRKYISHAKELTTYLITDYDSSEGKKQLLRFLKRIIGEFESIQLLISGVRKAIAEFQLTLIEMIEELGILLEETKESVTFNEQAILVLVEKIRRLQEEVNKANKSAIDSLGIASTTAIAGGVVAAFGGPPGKIASVLFFGVSLFFGGKALTKSMEVIAKKGVINVNELESDKHTDDVAVLTIFMEQLKDILKNTQKAQDSLMYIGEKWEGLSVSVNQLHNLATEATELTYRKIFPYVLRDLKEMNIQWALIYGQVEGLKIDVNISDANLELGMSEGTVIKLVNQSSVSSNIDYFNLKAV